MPAGVPIHSERSASTTVVIGFAFAIAASTLGIESVGTYADETNVSGKMTIVIIAEADSGEDAMSPKKQ